MHDVEPSVPLRLRSVDNMDWIIPSKKKKKKTSKKSPSKKKPGSKKKR